MKRMFNEPMTYALMYGDEVNQIMRQREKERHGYYFSDEELGLLHEIILSFGTTHHTPEYYRQWQEKLERFRDNRMHPNQGCYCGNNCTCGG